MRKRTVGFLVATGAVAIGIWFVQLAGGCDRITGGGEVVTRISGVVTNSQTGEPIDSVVIYETDSSLALAITDSTGTYLILPYGYRVIHIYYQKEGYRTQVMILRSSKFLHAFEHVDIRLVPE
jgi:hypothetical protein